MMPAILFTLFIAFLIGRNVARSVPDEITPSRPYLSLAPDAFLLVIAALVLAPRGLHPWLALLIPAWICARILLKERARLLHAPIAGAFLAVGGAPLGIIAILCLAMNYLIGALARDTTDAVLSGIGQPIAAGALLLLL